MQICAFARSRLAGAAAAFTLAVSSLALANSGTQLPFTQYQAGSEQTSSLLVTNGNFEQPGPTGRLEPTHEEHPRDAAPPGA